MSDTINSTDRGTGAKLKTSVTESSFGVDALQPAGSGAGVREWWVRCWSDEWMTWESHGGMVRHQQRGGEEGGGKAWKSLSSQLEICCD